jgi:hypothetical protein
MANNANMYYVYPAMDAKVRAMDHLEKIRRNRDELRERLARLELELQVLEARRGFAHIPTPQYHQVHQVHQVHCVYPVHQVHVARPVAYVPMGNVGQASRHVMREQRQASFDISKVDPIFREAAKDKSLKLQFMDCTDLAIQCAIVRHCG